jgi:hypothetical protein
VGRASDLEKLETGLAKRGAVAVSTSIEGLAGVGKTELALQLIDRLSRTDRFPGGIVWFDAAERDLTPQWGGAIATALAVGEGPVLERAHSAMRIIASGGPALLVLDNVASWTEAGRPHPLPSGAHLSLAITTRERRLGGQAFTHVELHCLAPGPARELLAEVSQRNLDREPGTDDLLTHLDGHALAIELAGAFLAEVPDVTPAVYLSRLRAGEPVQDEVRAQVLHERTVSQVLDATWERLDEPARQAWQTVSEFADADATLELLNACAIDESARRALLRFHLLAHADGRWTMYRRIRDYSSSRRIAETPSVEEAPAAAPRAARGAPSAVTVVAASLASAAPEAARSAAQMALVDRVVCVHVGSRVIGSGFRISERHVVTCAHVVDVEGVLLVDNEKATRIWSGTDSGSDLAVLEVQSLKVPEIRIGFGWDERQASRCEVVVAGRRGDVIESDRGMILDRVRVSYPEGGPRSTPGFRLKLDRPIEPGQSGGPVIDVNTGAVIAVLTMRQSGDSYAVTLDALPLTLRPTAQQEADESSSARLLPARAAREAPSGHATLRAELSVPTASPPKPSIFDEKKRDSGHRRSRDAVLKLVAERPVTARQIAGVDASLSAAAVADAILRLAPDLLVDRLLGANVDREFAREFAQNVLPCLPEWEGDVTICIQSLPTASTASVALARGTLSAAEAVMAAIDGRAMRLSRIPGESHAAGEYAFLLPSTTSAPRFSSPETLQSDLVATLGRGLEAVGAHPKATIDNINARVDRMISPKLHGAAEKGRPYLVVRDADGHAEALWTWVHNAIDGLQGIPVVRLTVLGAPGIEAPLQTALQDLFDSNLCYNRFTGKP